MGISRYLERIKAIMEQEVTDRKDAKIDEDRY